MNKYFYHIQLSIYLFIIGILAVNIHIQMLKLGIPHPDAHYIKPVWMEPLKIFTQLIGVYWISKKIKLKPHNNFKKIIILFLLFSAMMQLILRLPLTSGYVNGEAFLFTWVAAYFPQLIWILISSTLIVVLNASQKISKSKTYIISILGIYSTLSWLVIIPSINNLTAGLLVFFTPANPQDILLPPYDLTTTIIASLSFVEPTIAYFIVGLLIWDNNSKSKTTESLKLIFVIMVISQSLVRHITFVLNSDLPFVAENLSVGQFTLEWIFVGIMISFLLPWYHKKTNE